MHDAEELLTPFINPILELNPATSLMSLSSNHQTFNIAEEEVAMHRVESIPAPDFALEASYSHNSLRGPLGSANVRQLNQPFPRRDSSSSSSTTRNNFAETPSLLFLSTTR
jgi:hypothetical protein